MVDYWDGLAVVGLGLVVGGVALWNIPAAIVLSGVALLSLYYLRESGSAAQSPAERVALRVKDDEHPGRDT